MSKTGIQVRKMSLAAMFLAMGWLFPFITGQIPEFGNMLSPMHIPVFLSGFVLGPWYGLAIGFITPISRSIMFTTPPLYPIATSMAFELAAYGFLSGLLFRLFIKRLKPIPSIYVTLGISMIVGRVVWGIAQYFSGLFATNPFTFQMFINGAFLIAWPGMLIQIILIPLIIKTLYSAHVLDKFMDK